MFFLRALYGKNMTYVIFFWAIFRSMQYRGAMRKKREFIPGATYHVTSRTNGKTRVFDRYLGQRIMLLTLEDAKERFRFRLHNFCVMPTHIHLLITPAGGTDLSGIMHWIKTHSAKRWNCIHGSIDHLWGNRYFERIIKDLYDYFSVYKYIDQNPVKSGLTQYPQDWRPSGAYHIANNLTSLVDYFPSDRLSYIKYLPEWCLAP